MKACKMSGKQLKDCTYTNTHSYTCAGQNARENETSTANLALYIHVYLFQSLYHRSGQCGRM